ncbi:hypothetical protein NVP1161O_220 [Vibrio phage 1.161.O._10N.261.48.C5]|nr:hypothetical protein NVP1161O_220 [Vibrio phage 1.161.O._10N.261.48.C5]
MDYTSTGNLHETMSISEAQHLLYNKFTMADSLNAPSMLNERGEVSEEFIKFCIDNEYLGG